MTVERGEAVGTSPGGSSGGPEPRPGRYRVFAVVSAALFMSSVDQTIVATGLGTLQRDLHSTINWSSWTITIYALGQIVAMPLAGSVSDQYGRKNVFVAGILIFTISSLGCGLSQNIQTLLVLRAVQALGGGCLTPAATGIVADEFGRDRDRAIGFFSSIFPIGGMTGPILGGLFVTYWSWRGIFLINVPIGLALCVVAMVRIPSRSVRRPARFDVVGVGLLGGGLLGCMAAISYLGTGTARVTDAWFTGPAAAGVLLLCGFLRHSARAPAPFVSISLLAGPGWGVVNFINFFYGAAALGFGPLIPVYAEQRYQLEPLGAGSLLSARSIGMVVVAGVATMALRRTGTRKPIVVGYLIGAIGMALVAIRPLGMSPYVWLSVGAAVAGIGMGISTPASNNAGMQLAPGAAASAAGLRGMFRQAGSITGVSVIAAIVARNDHPAQTEAAGFLAFAVVLVLLLPLVRLVPDQRGRW